MVAGRPRIWQPFATIKWAPGYEFTDNGDVRDRHRNVLAIGMGPQYPITLRLYDTNRKVRTPRRDVLALEYCGLPDRHHCVICDERRDGKVIAAGLPYSVVHLNGDRTDFSRGNLKYAPRFASARRHELAHIQWAMTHNDVPPRRWTLSTRMLAIEAENQEQDEQLP
ncbi:hypothetical protein [Mycobacterium paraffinicum]|uniref:HNH endonuclease n=1 Tax=Mycobacterium paraffinicum TaxID=53378 RepID=A0ABP8F949_9MYCO|nr:hypothetical protein [Mycobacterium paraffinicum]MCV7309874.1 hypothetical protein [Mycobacterium paraffinicum]